MYIRIFMHDGEKLVLARATINALVGRVVARGPPVAHPWPKLSLFSNALEVTN